MNPLGRGVSYDPTGVFPPTVKWLMVANAGVFVLDVLLRAYLGVTIVGLLGLTPAAVIDDAMREEIFPMGPFELGDQAGLDIASGMFDTIHAASPVNPEPLVWKLRELKRFGT